MARTRIKICCIASAAEAATAAAAGADLLGLVGPMPSGPGILTHGDAAAIARAAPVWARPVLLTAAETAAEIATAAAAAEVDAVQVVNHIDPAESTALARLPLLYLQVIHVEDEATLTLAERYGAHCDAFLLDSGHPAEGVLGGTGKTHDWALSARFRASTDKPVFLAGGLTPANVGEAIATVQPFGVDLCTGVRRDGALDPARLSAFIAAVAAADCTAARDAA